MSVLKFLNHKEVSAENGKIKVQKFSGSQIGFGFVTFLVIFCPLAILVSNLTVSFLAALTAGCGAASCFYYWALWEARRVNQTVQPHKALSEIIDWEKRDNLILNHFNRVEYLGVTDDLKILIGQKKKFSPRRGPEYKKVFSLPPRYVKKYLKKNPNYRKRKQEKQKEKALEKQDGSYQEYLDTLSEQRKKIT